jgi:hypothetical protein
MQYDQSLRIEGDVFYTSKSVVGMSTPGEAFVGTEAKRRKKENLRRAEKTRFVSFMPLISLDFCSYFPRLGTVLDTGHARVTRERTGRAGF